MGQKNLRITASALIYSFIIIFVMLPLFESSFGADSKKKITPPVKVTNPKANQSTQGPKMPRRTAPKTTEKKSKPWSATTWISIIIALVFVAGFFVFYKLYKKERQKDPDSKKAKLFRALMAFSPSIGFAIILIVVLSARVYIHKIDPIMIDFSLFGMQIRIAYYGIIYAFGFVLTYIWMRYSIKYKTLDFKIEELDTFFIYICIGVVLGARVFEAIFYVDPWYNFFWWKQGFASWSKGWKFIKVWEGGLSAHGGMAGAVIATLLFCRKKQKSFYEIMDVIVIPAALALALGRFANYINGELYGVMTSGDWGVIFANEARPNVTNMPRIPTQLFESLKNLLIFSILFTVKPKLKKAGMLAWMWGLLYGIFRFIIEFWKDFEIIWNLGRVNFTMGHILSLAMIGVCGFMLFIMSSDKKISSILPITDKIKSKPKPVKKKKPKKKKK